MAGTPSASGGKFGQSYREAVEAVIAASPPIGEAERERLRLAWRTTGAELRFSERQAA